MRFKEKLRYTILGSVLTLIGVVIGLSVSTLTADTQEATFDKIKCRELIVENEDGTLESILKAGQFSMGSVDSGNLLYMYSHPGDSKLSVGGGVTLQNFLGKWDTEKRKFVDEYKKAGRKGRSAVYIRHRAFGKSISLTCTERNATAHLAGGGRVIVE